MLNAILVIARARFLIARNTFWRGNIGRKIGISVLLIALGFGAWGLYWLMSSAVQFFTSMQFIDALSRAQQTQPGMSFTVDIQPQPFLEALPSIVLFGALVLLILTSFGNLLASLYLSGDMDMLLVAPVPMRSVFVVKFFSGLVIPYIVLFVLLGPALLGFGQGLGYGWAYYLMVVVVLALFPLLPVGVGALLVMAVVRVIPARRAREIVGLISGLIGAAWWILSQFSREIAPRMATVNTLDNLRRLNVPVLPSAWAGHALLAAGQGEWLTLLVYGGLYVVLSIGVFMGCVLLTERLYYAGWSNMAVQGGRVRRRTTNDKRQTLASGAPQSFVHRLSSIVLPPQSAAIFAKDLRLFPRDLRNVQQLIFPIVLAIVWTYQLIRNSAAAGGQAQFQQVWGSFASVGISFFICLSLSNVMAGTGISREGRSFWLLKIAPVSAWQILIGKLALAYLPFLVVGTVFVAGLSLLQGNSATDFVRSLLLVWLVGLGTTSITLGMGAAFPKFNWENPNQQSTVRAGCLAPVLYAAYTVLAAAAALGLPLLGALLLPAWTTLLSVAGWVIVVALTAGVTWGMLSFGAARLEQVEVA
jgi:ABC-2 type transport system permease protein